MTVEIAVDWDRERRVFHHAQQPAFGLWEISEHHLLQEALSFVVIIEERVVMYSWSLISADGHLPDLPA